MTIVHSLRAEYRRDSGFVASPRPRLSWVSRTDVRDWHQSAAELEWDTSTGRETARLAGPESVFVEWPFEGLAPHHYGRLRVRVQGSDGWTDWSRPITVAAGYPDCWRAPFVGLARPSIPAQPALLRTEFDIAAGLTRATLYATAHGIYRLRLNGEVVGDEVLKPGWTAYQHRIVHETTDVTALLVPGLNAVGVELVGGWHTERYGFNGLDHLVYGEQPSFAGQLYLEYADGATAWVTTGADWLATAGPRLSSGLYAGEHYDARLLPRGWAHVGFDPVDWQPVRLEADGIKPTPRFGPVARVTQVLGVAEVVASADDRIIVDFGQNLVGWLRIRVCGPAGHTVTLRHAEVLENGELSTRPLRRATAVDRYTLAGTGVEEWEPLGTYHGFRFVEIQGWPGDFDPHSVDALVVHSDMPRTGHFECSNELVNKLHQNIVWGMRGNFLHLPTDCPQRDERLGWTGDIQVFAPAATFFYDSDGFLASWLCDLACEQSESGCVPFVVPDVLSMAETPAAGWGDAATVVPWVLFERFGDRGVLQAQYPSMKAWVDLLLSVAGQRNLWENGFQFGDWLDPDAPPQCPERAKTDPDLVASAYLFRSTDLLARTAAELGVAADAEYYRAAAEKVRQAWLAEYVTPSGRVVSDAQTGYALALEFGLAIDPELRRILGDRLAWLARRDGYRIGTGFVGTPLVTDALTHSGHAEEAGRLLLQTECPSWLYPVTMGATTIWERWDAMLPDGSVNPGEMTSFNHYAFGAVADWLHRCVAGLAATAPGYRRIEIAPQPLTGLNWASAHLETPYGTASSEWRRAGDDLVVKSQIPANTAAAVRLPGTQAFEVGSGCYEWTVPLPAEREPVADLGVHCSLATLIDDAEAYQAMVTALRQVNPERTSEFLARATWIPGRPLMDAYSLLSADMVDGVADAFAKLNARRCAIREREKPVG